MGYIYMGVFGHGVYVIFSMDHLKSSSLNLILNNYIQMLLDLFSQL